MVQASLSSISLLGRGKQVKTQGLHHLPTRCSETSLSLPHGSREVLILEEETLKETDTLPSAILQEIDQLLAKQLLLRDHSPLGITAVFTLTI